MTPGAEAIVDGLCGCQFARQPIRVRLIAVLPHVTLGPDLIWVSVYELTSWGDVARKRELLVIRRAFETACDIGLTHRPRRAPKRAIPSPRKEVSCVDA